MNLVRVCVLLIASLTIAIFAVVVPATDQAHAIVALGNGTPLRDEDEHGDPEDCEPNFVIIGSGRSPSIGTLEIHGRRLAACRYQMYCNKPNNDLDMSARSTCLSSSSTACPTWRQCRDANYSDQEISTALLAAPDSAFSTPLYNQVRDISPYPAGAEASP